MDKNDLLKYAGEYIKLYPKKETNYFSGEPQFGWLVKTGDDLYLLQETRDIRLYTSGIESVEIVPEEQIVSTIPKAKQKELGITQEDLKRFTQPFNEKEFRKKVIEEPFMNAVKNVKPYEIRNDRFRQFGCWWFDATTVDSVGHKWAKPCWDLSPEWRIVLVVKGKEYDVGREKEEYRNELIEWWKYWKQN